MKGNILGDIRAENDTSMLDKAFFETADYKSLLESTDRCVIVGRRGTGKSALVYRLNRYWQQEPKKFVITIAPHEDQIIGLRVIVKNLGDNFLHIKAGAKIAWRYALYMEVLCAINRHYKTKKTIETSGICSHIKEWCDNKSNITSKLRKKLASVIKSGEPSESIIADLADALEIQDLERALSTALQQVNYKYSILVDRLDEGYSPDDLGVALVDGFVQAVIEINSKFNDKVNSLVFLRDNMFRSIARSDPDFTRNIEGQVLRLHWDEDSLFNLVCNRLRIAHSVTQENNARVWNDFATQVLKGREGFRLTLRLTLYRPRDILVLLNNAFLHAASAGQKKIILKDIESSAKSISDHRLQDLHKEYESIFPALPSFTSAFNSKAPEFTIRDSKTLIDPILKKDDHPVTVQADIAIFENYIQVLQRLYGIGFLGVYDETASSFVFCHDGRAPEKEIDESSRLLVHPCYWLALNLTQRTLDLEDAEDIYDEYDIEVSSITTEQRASRISKMIEEIKELEPGRADAHQFEDWCLRAIKLVFAGSLSNIEMHPNTNGLQQRDIVATNMAQTPVWKRILEDYKTRQIVFEVKNYAETSGKEYRQLHSYMCNEYGDIAFMITRDSDNNLTSGKDLDWAKEIFFNHKKIIIKLSEKYLVKHLSKLRSPQKHDAANKELNKLLDTYIRRYLILKSR